MPSATGSSTRPPPTSAYFDHYPHLPFPSSSQQHPPTKASLKAWWSQFTSNQKSRKDPEIRQNDEHPVFGKPLQESLRYASVQISTSDSNGRLYVWGYIPVVVAKCGLYLKENATEVEGTFRVNGSNKRMKDLQAAFETPPRYGKGLDWKQENYTTHDVASVFRRYLTYMPEPVIPCGMYHSFRDPLAKAYYNTDEVIKTYKSLIRQMPRLNQYLLLYVLDLLAVFARKYEKNLMTAANLAVMFQPGIISHPNHEMSPQEHTLSQKVLEFLIVNQDWFMLDIPPPTVNDRGGSRSSTPPKLGHNLVLIPSKESDNHDDNSWHHVEKPSIGPRKMTRRKTTLEQRRESQDKAEGDPTPVADRPSSSAGVSRSRTLPSSRSRAFTISAIANVANASTTSNSHADKARVLRKQKRTPPSQQLQSGSTKES